VAGETRLRSPASFASSVKLTGCVAGASGMTGLWLLARSC